MNYLDNYQLPKQFFFESVGDVLDQHHCEIKFYHQIVRKPEFFEWLVNNNIDKATDYLSEVLSCSKLTAKIIFAQMTKLANKKLEIRVKAPTKGFMMWEDWIYRDNGELLLYQGGVSTPITLEKAHKMEANYQYYQATQDMGHVGTPEQEAMTSRGFIKDHAGKWVLKHYETDDI